MYPAKDARELAILLRISREVDVVVSAYRKRAPIRGNITAVLKCEQHTDYWNALQLHELTPGGRRELSKDALSAGWATMPLTPENAGQAAPPQPPAADSA